MHCEFIGNLVLPDRIVYGGKIICESGIIVDIVENIWPEHSQLPYILPGLVDIHNHGALGYDYMDSTEEAFYTISKHLIRHGVTSTLCTTDSTPKDETIALQKA